MFVRTVHLGFSLTSSIHGHEVMQRIMASIDCEVLVDIDPRVQLGNLITKIEATDGIVRLMIQDKPKAEAYPVEFRIPALGAYSETWPQECAQSDAIVKGMSEYLRKADTWGWGAALLLLSTGEDEDLLKQEEIGLTKAKELDQAVAVERMRADRWEAPSHRRGGGAWAFSWRLGRKPEAAVDRPAG